MERAKIEDFDYVAPDSFVTLGTKRSLKKKYPDYQIKERKDGFFVLSRGIQCNVTVSWNEGMKTFNMKEEILKLYNRERMTEALFEKFREALNEDEYQIWIDGNGQCVIKLT